MDFEGVGDCLFLARCGRDHLVVLIFVFYFFRCKPLLILKHKFLLTVSLVRDSRLQIRQFGVPGWKLPLFWGFLFLFFSALLRRLLDWGHKYWGHQRFFLNRIDQQSDKWLISTLLPFSAQVCAGLILLKELAPCLSLDLWRQRPSTPSWHHILFLYHHGWLSLKFLVESWKFCDFSIFRFDLRKQLLRSLVRVLLNLLSSFLLRFNVRLESLNLCLRFLLQAFQLLLQLFGLWAILAQLSCQPVYFLFVFFGLNRCESLV